MPTTIATAFVRVRAGVSSTTSVILPGQDARQDTFPIAMRLTLLTVRGYIAALSAGPRSFLFDENSWGREDVGSQFHRGFVSGAAVV